MKRDEFYRRQAKRRGFLIDPEEFKSELRHSAEVVLGYEQQGEAARDYYNIRDKHGLGLDLAKVRNDYRGCK